MSEGITVIKNTAPKYLKGAADQTIRGHFWLGFLQAKGRIVIGDTGHTSCTWNVKARQPEVRQSGDGAQLIFAENDAYEQLEIDVRGYHATDKLSEKKKLMNNGPLQIVDLYGTKIEDLVKSMTNTFGEELYIDGYAAGNENRLCGLESFMGTGGTTNAGDIIATPSDTYAGKSTALANLGGTWSANLTTKPNATLNKDWPEGQGSSEYDYLAPKVYNLSSTGWNTGGTDWLSNGARVMRRARLHTNHVSGFGSAPMLHMLSPGLYAQFLDGQDAAKRMIVPHKESQDLGFSDGIEFEGAIVKQDYGCPAGQGYGINVNEMLLFNIHDDGSFFMSKGPEYDMRNNEYLFAILFYGNMRFNPKAFCKYKAIA